MADEIKKLQPLARKNKPSKVEAAKAASNHLRGTLAEELANPEKPDFDHDDQQLLKFHGIYQQDNRDAREAAKALGTGKEYSFMIRIKAPGGPITAEQYLALDQLADEVTYNNSLRLTTRQCIQLHGVLKVDLKKAIRRCTEILLPTVCGCGDVERNIMAPAAPVKSYAHAAIIDLAKKMIDELTPKSNAYFEIWMDGEKVDTASTTEAEPVYGDLYLPRKFKTGIAIPEDNSADVYSQDVGFIADVQDGEVIGANVLVGGGFGMTHKKVETYARLGSQLGYVAADKIVDTVKLITTIFRDYGDRTDRKHARLKYVVEEYGIDAFRAEFEERAGFKLQPWKDLPKLRHADWLGKHEQGDGKYFYGVYVENGRIIDTEHSRMKEAFRKIVETINPSIILTSNQNLIFSDLQEEDVEKIERVLDAYQIKKVESISLLRRHAMACVSLPTCPLALTEAERVMPEVIEAFENEFARLGIDDVPLTIRMTGCPNGCARPYAADIGLVGHKPGHYDIFLGGRIEGDRVSEHYEENVPMEELITQLRPLFEHYRASRNPGEAFGDYYQRAFGNGRRFDLVTGDRDNPAKPRVDAMLSA